MSLTLTDLERSNQDGFEIGDILSSIRRRWKFVACVTALCFLAALYLVLTATPKFTLNGAMYLGEGAGQQANNDNSFLTDFQNSSNVNTEVSLLESQALVERAILETGLNAQVNPLPVKPMTFWRWKFLYARSIDAFGPKPGALVAQDASIADPGSGGANVLLTFGQNGAFTAVGKGGWASAPPASFSGQLGEPVSSAGISFVLKSSIPGDVPKPGSKYALAIQPAKAVAQGLQGQALTIAAGGGPDSATQVADIRLLWNNPYQGAVFLNQLMQDFMGLQLSWNTESASDTENFVDSELAKVRTQMQQADQALAAYQAKTGMVDVSANAQTTISELSQYEVQRTALLLRQKALSELLQTIHASHHSNPYLISEINDPVLSSLATALASSEAQLSNQRATFTGAAPEVQSQSASVGSLETSVRELITNDQASAEENLENIDAVIADLQSKLKVMPAESLQVDALTRASDVASRLYVMLMQKDEEAEVSKAGTIVGSRIVSPAEVPLGATTPKATLMLLAGLVFGLLLSSAWVLAQRAFSGRFQSYDEVRRYVPAEVYGMVPMVPRLERQAPMLTHETQTPFSESIRMLRMNLYHNFSVEGAKVICLTSAEVADGKSTVAVNLARFLAEDGKRTVIVDADLHQGKLDAILGVRRTPGLTDYVLEKHGLITYAVPEQKFYSVPSGTPASDPSELLNRERLGGLFDELRRDFDYIIVDCPPLPVVSDTLTLLKFADLVLSVVYVERTSRRNFALHLAALRAQPCQHGVIINGVFFADSVYGYYAAQNGNFFNRAKRVIA